MFAPKDGRFRAVSLRGRASERTASSTEQPLRNVFDQYEQRENRVTHALATALAEDAGLLRAFLKELADCTPPRGARLTVEEQALPGEAESGGDSEERGLPDIWIHDGEDWALIIEAKVTAAVSASQLRRHLAIAARRGVRRPQLLLITAIPVVRSLPPSVRRAEWRRVYSWLAKHAPRSPWAKRAGVGLAGAG